MKKIENFYHEANCFIEFVCDECCLPLSLYGENIILTFEGDKIITKVFCNLHAFEFLDEEDVNW